MSVSHIASLALKYYNLLPESGSQTAKNGEFSDLLASTADEDFSLLFIKQFKMTLENGFELIPLSNANGCLRDGEIIQ